MIVLCVSRIQNNRFHLQKQNQKSSFLVGVQILCLLITTISLEIQVQICFNIYLTLGNIKVGITIFSLRFFYN